MANSRLTRRRFVGTSLLTPFLGGARPVSRAHEGPDGGKGSYKLYWGDLHNHNAVGYARGTLERSIDIASEHLDFFAFTGHAWWHDIPELPGDKHMKWINGFKAHREHWPKTRSLIREANTQKFSALLGYEWHSSQFGDYCLVFAEDQPELFLPDHVRKLLRFADEKRALAIPHHLAYARGWRGANFDYFASEVSPVVEIFSEHGCSESVNAAAGDFIRHSMGGRVTENSVERQLRRGLRFGFVASSDDHRGYPGAYGEGLVAVWARDLSTRSLVESIRQRRTYAVTGDRIALDFTLNDQPMGSELAPVRDRQIDIRVEAPESIKMIELIRNGRVIDRHFPEDTAETPAPLPGRVKCRLRYGWGPWAALGMGRICDWRMKLRLQGGRFVSALPCFQTAPFDEERRDQLRHLSQHELLLVSHTSRVNAFAEDPTKAIVMEIEAEDPSAVLTVELSKPTVATVAAELRRLQNDNEIHFTGGFTSESYMLERLVGPSECTAELRFHDTGSGVPGADWYYVRVLQHNNHMAWSSPIWVGNP